MTAAQIADKYGVPRHLIYGRLRAGWDIKKAIEEPVDEKKRRKIDS